MSEGCPPTPAQLARADQELACLDLTLQTLVENWPEFFSCHPRPERVGALMHELERHHSITRMSLLALVSVAVEWLACGRTTAAQDDLEELLKE